MSTISASTTSTTAFKITTDTTGALVFQTGSSPTTALTLDTSQNMGLGVTPSATGSSYKSFELGFAGVGLNARSNATLDVDQGVYWTAGSAPLYASTGVAAAHYRLSSGTHVWQTAASGTAGNAITFTQAMTLDASGNLGLGVTPSAWNASIKVLEMPDSGFFAFANTNGNISTNTFFDTGYKYKASAAAARYSQSSGQHIWYNAASGTAGNAITFTQAMTLDASGNLGIGTTSPSYRLDIDKGSAGIVAKFKGGTKPAYIYSDDNAVYFCSDTSVATAFGCNETSDLLTFYTGNAERARIDSSGRFAVGTTNITGGGFNPTIAAKSFADSIGGGILVEGSGADSTLSMGYDGTSMFLSSSYRTTAGYKPIALYTSGTERVRVDTSGRVTMPYQVGFSAYGPATGTAQSSIVIYGSTRYNQGSNYSTSTGVFTAPIAGRYFFTFNSLMNVNGTYVRLYFRVNGVANATYGDTLCGGDLTAWTGWSYISIGMSIVLNLAQNDTVAVWNDGPSTTYGTAYGTFCGYLLG